MTDSNDEGNHFIEEEDSLVLNNYYYGFDKNSDQCDTIFEVEGVRLYVNKCYLSMISPVFKVMLHYEHQFKEAHTRVVEFPGKSVETFCSFLAVLYHRRIPSDDDKWRELIPLFHEYQIKAWLHYAELQLEEYIDAKMRRLKKRVVEDPRELLTIKQQSEFLDEICECYLLAELYGMEDLSDIAMSSLKEFHSKLLKMSDKFKTLPSEVKVKVLFKRLNTVDKVEIEESEEINEVRFRHFDYNDILI